jgi:hypothetical protein
MTAQLERGTFIAHTKSNIGPKLVHRLISRRIASDMRLTRALHPNPFEANGMPPTYETMH